MEVTRPIVSHDLDDGDRRARRDRRDRRARRDRRGCDRLCARAGGRRVGPAGRPAQPQRRPGCAVTTVAAVTAVTVAAACLLGAVASAEAEASSAARSRRARRDLGSAVTVPAGAGALDGPDSDRHARRPPGPGPPSCPGHGGHDSLRRDLPEPGVCNGLLGSGLGRMTRRDS